MNQSPFSVDQTANALDPYSDTISTIASSLTNGSKGAVSSARAVATGYASSSVQQWLSQFGTASIQLNVDDNGNWDDSSVDLLAPLYDNKKSILFTQLGLRAPDGRVTGNIGMGVRTFYLENWMFGGNSFFDNDFTGKNRRVGLGAEAWTNNLKLSANAYLGTTQWHQSDDFSDYNEKPANGYDIRAEGYLPAYPQLGAKVIYEKYHGDKVALFDTDHLQKNPSAVTTGVSYTPIPLTQIAINYKRGQDSLSDTQFQLNLHYDLGRSWAYQIDPASVSFERSLAGSRYDLVERNNQIVLQYQKKKEQRVSNLSLNITVDNSPSDGLTPNTAQVLATGEDGQPVRNARIDWSITGSAKLVSSSSVTNDSGITSVNFTNTMAEAVQITAKNGAVSATQNSLFNVVTVRNLDLKITKDNSQADGKTADRAQATVTDINNRPIANSKITWGLDAPATLHETQTLTDANGHATADFTSTTVGAVMLSAAAGDKSASQAGHFVSDAASNTIDSIVATKNGSPADGKTPDIVVVTVKDGSGLPASNVNVSLSADKPTVVFGIALQAAKATKPLVTDAQGQVSASLADTVTEAVKVTATLDNSNNKSTSVNFVGDAGTAAVNTLTTTSGAQANGTESNTATATVLDAHNNPIEGATVNWSTTGSATLGQSAVTNAEGKTTISFTDIKAETVTLSASTGNTAAKTGNSTFKADSSTATVSTLTTTTGAQANGTDSNTATATVLDASHNPVEGVTVNWTTTGSAALAQPTTTTDANGKATVNITDTVAETVTITAAVGSTPAQTKDTTFKADTNTAAVSILTATTGAAANGSDTNSATATVLDAHNNRVSGATVIWNTTGKAALSQSETTTGNDGKSTISYTDTTAETVTLSAHVGSTPAKTKDSTFKAESGTAAVSDLTIVADNALANGTATNTATATVVDANNNPVPNVSVNWGTTGSAALNQQATTTDANGKASVSFTDTTAETVTVSANVTGTSAKTKDSTFKADATTAAVTTLTITSDNALANGTATNTASATVLDAHNNPIQGATVSWTATGNALLGQSATTDAHGITTVSFTDTTAETVTIAATVGSTPAKTKDSSFISDSSTAMVSTLTIDTDNALANGTASNTATATVLDAQNNPIKGATVSWSTTGSASLGESATTDADGKTTLSFTDTTAETVTISAAVGSTAAKTKESTFKSDSSTAAVSTLEITTDNAPANGTATNAAAATVVDTNGNPVPNIAVTWTTSGSAIPTQSTSTTDANGIATINYTDTAAEIVTLSAAVGSTPAKTKDSTFIADSSTAIVSDLTVTNGAKADGIETNTAIATVLDAHNNPVKGVTVDWATTGSAILSQSATPTDATGKTTISLTDTTEEEVTVSAAVGSTTAQSKTSKFISPIPVIESLTLTPATTDAIYGGYQHAPTTVTATVKDSSGKAIPDAAVAATLDPNVIISPESGRTDGNGQLVFTVTAKKTGELPFSATATLGASTKTATTNIQIKEDLSATLSYTVTPAGSSLTKAQVADGFTFTVAPWTGMAIGDSLSCLYIYDGKLSTISGTVIVDNSNWGTPLTVTTAGYTVNKSSSGYLRCAVTASNGYDSGPISPNSSTINISR